MSPTRYRILSLLALSIGLATTAFPQSGSLTSMSMASYGPIVAPDSIAVSFGTNLASATNAATSLPLPPTLGTTTVSITDSSGAKLTAPLFMTSAGQVNFLVPANAALGKATITINSGTTSSQGTLLISNVSPAIFTANGNGKGVPAAQVVRVNAAGALTLESPFQTNGSSQYVTSPISLSSSTDRIYLMLYGTGVRRHSLNPVKATINGVGVPVTYAGAQSQFPGLDQIDIGPLPQSLAGTGEVDLILYVDGVPANTVRVAFR